MRLLSPPAHVHGDYRVEDISALATRYDISCWLIPSIWPETFSYTTHEALATGLPVFAFDLGAQGDAVAMAASKRGDGGIIPLVDGKVDISTLVALITRSRQQAA